MSARSPAAVRACGLLVNLRSDRLLFACAARGLSLTRLAEEARVSLPTVRAAVNGRAVRPISAYKIAAALQRLPPPADADEFIQPF
jgi:transcriptional regulator with XRE-family HTH domain